MNKKIKKYIIIGISALATPPLLFLVFVAIARPLYFRFKYGTEETKSFEALFPVGLENDRGLVGASHHVFVGKVIEQVGTKSRRVMPETQFAIDVILSIKGDLRGRVVVDQLAGYKDGKLYTLEGGDTVAENGNALLQPGSTYLFATRYNREENWHTITFQNRGLKLLSSDNDLTNDELHTLAQQNENVKRWQEAYPNEILLDADVKNNNTPNSYKSLHPEAPSNPTSIE